MSNWKPDPRTLARAQRDWAVIDAEKAVVRVAEAWGATVSAVDALAMLDALALRVVALGKAREVQRQCADTAPAGVDPKPA